MIRRSNRQEPLLNPTLEELARTERNLRKNRAAVVNTMAGREDHQERDQPNPHQQPVMPGAGIEGLNPQQIQQLLQLLQQQNNEGLHRGEEIGQAHRPHAYYRDSSPIILPPITRPDFELKANLIQLAEAKPFCGLPSENPMSHLERIEKICGTTKIQGVSQDYIRCKLFEFSLMDKAANWLSSLPPESLNGWTGVRNSFLDHFFTKSKTAELKLKISGFKQLSGESFSEAWERFKGYKRDCPHHGFTELQLLNIFYDGVNREHKTALNAASYGNFMTRTVLDGTKLIENLAESSASSSSEYDRTNRNVHLVDSQKITERLENIERLLKANDRDVHAVNQEEDYDFADISYVNGQQAKQGFNQNYRNHPNLSYRSQNVENPQDQVYPTSPANFNTNTGFKSSQGYQGQRYQQPYQPPPFRNQGYQRPQGNFNAQFQPKDPLEDLRASMNLMISNQQRAEQRHEERFNSLDAKFDSLQSHVKKLDTQVAQNAEAIRRQPGTLPGRPEGNPRHEHVNSISSISLSQPRVTAKEAQEVKISDLENSVSNLSISALSGNSEVRRRRSIFTRSVPRSEPPPLTPEEEAYAILPYPEAVDALPKASKPSEKAKSESCAKLFADSESDGQEDQGSFCIPIVINNTHFPLVICDTGASINQLPLESLKEAGFDKDDLEDVDCHLFLADGSWRKPLGKLVGIMVEVDHTQIPTDFMVINDNPTGQSLILLGRPFLDATNAVMNFKDRTIDLHLKHKSLRYYVDDPYLFPEYISRKEECASVVTFLQDSQEPRQKHIGAFKVKMMKFRAGKQEVVRSMRYWKRHPKLLRKRRFSQAKPYGVLTDGSKQILHELPRNRPQRKPPGA